MATTMYYYKQLPGCFVPPPSQPGPPPHGTKCVVPPPRPPPGPPPSQPGPLPPPPKYPSPGIYNPPTVGNKCKKIRLTILPKNIGAVIGKQGYYFNVITYVSNASYIWYDKEKQVIEVWGENDAIINDAERRLIERMDSVEWMFIKNKFDMYKINFNDSDYDTYS